MKDTYGRSLPLPSMRFDLDSLSWRTCEATSLWDLEMSSPSFPEWGTTQGGELYELPTPERPTVAQGFSSLPTPTVIDSKGPVAMQKNQMDKLRDITGHGLRPAQELKALGNGVCPQQALLALHMLLD